MEYPHFVGGSASSSQPFHDGALTLNYYVEQAQGPGGKSRHVLMPIPGMETFATPAVPSDGRASFSMDGRAFVIIGATLYEELATGTLTTRGTVAVDHNPATITTNGDGGGQLLITSGGLLYIYDLTTDTLTSIPVAFTATIGGHLDGYFLVLDVTTSTFYISDLLDGTTWDPTQFAQRSIRPDPWVSMIVVGRYIWLLGEQTSEVWYNADAFPFPFAPHPSGLVPHGCAASFSPKVLSGLLFWVAASAEGHGQVMQAAGFTPSIVSTFAVQATIATASVISDAIGDTHEDSNGHSFYLLTLPNADLTFCYDATTTQDLPPSMRWTSRATWISEDARFVAWRPLFHHFAFGHHLMLDRAGGTVYRMSPNVSADVEGRRIRRVRRPPALWQENAWVNVSSFEVHTQPGVGLTSGQGVDPQMSLRVSPDGGKTFGAERSRSMGKRGEYGARVRWVLCGRGRQWMPEIVVTDPVPTPIVGASVTLKGAA
jgi:hypothetical protein